MAADLLSRRDCAKILGGADVCSLEREQTHLVAQMTITQEKVMAKAPNKKAKPVDPLKVPEQRALIDQIIAENKELPGAPMVVLGELQSRIGYVSFPMQDYVAKQLGVPKSQIYGVVSFYSFFTTEPRGKHNIKFCLGTACYVGGAPKLIDKAIEILGISMGETTDDWQISTEVCRCVGACSQAPTVMVDNQVYGRVTVNTLPEIIAKYQEA
ncbi:MAG: NAD(P)H-dependent oxidoreductase subunit E [Anaerolineales bacterium]|nr:NAD(P)H-dependent oxidoreductase subunit E [Anaerolineales bacterium]